MEGGSLVKGPFIVLVQAISPPSTPTSLCPRLSPQRMGGGKSLVTFVKKKTIIILGINEGHSHFGIIVATY